MNDEVTYIKMGFCALCGAVVGYGFTELEAELLKSRVCQKCVRRSYKVVLKEIPAGTIFVWNEREVR